IVRMMVGRTVEQAFPKQNVEIGKPVLRVENYSHPTEFRDISFELRKGEILGFYGLVGAGRSEFAQSLFGITQPSTGQVVPTRRDTSTPYLSKHLSALTISHLPSRFFADGRRTVAHAQIC